MFRSRPRPAAIAAGLLSLVVVVVLAVVLVGGEDRPVFRVGDESGSSDDGEGLMVGRRTASQRVSDDEPTRAPAVIERVGPGSVVLGFRTLVLDRDAEPVRIRQHTLADLLPYPGAQAIAAVTWSGYVATQRSPSAGDSAAATVFDDTIGPWRAAGRDGVLVRPGQQVRLRTRYDLRSRGRACRSLTLLDGPRWEVKEADGDWRILRARDDDGDRTRDVDVHSGQYGVLRFTAKRPCRVNGSTFYVPSSDGARDAEELEYSGS